MSFKKIENDMIVKNNIILEPRITFVSASDLCEDLISHGITSPGVYGEANALNTINSYNSDDVLGTRVYDVKNVTSNTLFVDVLNEARESPNTFEREINEHGLHFSVTHDYKYGIEKLKQKYTIDDSSMYKKKAVKNLYDYYNKNIQHRQLNSYWGFSNYNTINFFNIDESLNSRIVPNKTHSNCLSYPNLLNSESKPAYDFSSDDLTFSFYINQRRKNKKGYQFNPGCILHIPKLISIFIVKGSQEDINGLTECYRIYIELGDKTLFETNTSLLTLDFQSDLRQISSDKKIFLSSDNILKFNNWHNIAVTLSKRINSGNNSYTLKLYNDGVLIDETEVSVDKQDVNSTNSFVNIGNKFNDISNVNLQNYITELYSINKEEDDDIIGPYSTKSISFGSHSIDYITAINTDFTPKITNDLNLDTDSDYVIKSVTSHAFNGELHDIRIYNENIGNSIKSKICDLNQIDFLESSLLFAVPVFYYEADIKKFGLVNIHTTESGITRSNICIDGPVNSYFSNKCNGHEVSVENFLYEFKKKISPNIIFGGSIKDDNLHKSIELIYDSEDLTDITSTINKSVTRGDDLLDIYFKKIKSLLKPDELEIVRKNNFYYRNNLIMPNDNGLQEQLYDISGYYSNYNGFSHVTYGNEIDYQHINLQKVHSESSAMIITNDFISSISNQDLINYTATSGLLKSMENRENFYITRAIQEHPFIANLPFKESYDLFENASLNSFHKGLILDNNNNFNDMIGLRRRPPGTKIEAGPNFFLKDLSNPIARKINDDFRANGIANFLPAIASKVIDNSLVNPDNIAYFSYEMPYYNITKDIGETYSNVLCISNQLFKKNIIRESMNITDSALAGSGGNLKISLSDNGLGLLYRDDCLTKKAEWNYVGHVLYNEGFVTILHPGLENFSNSNYKISFKINTDLNVYELNLPAKAGETNLSNNPTYIQNLKLNDSAFNSDEDFVYITDINIHDKNLNVLASAKLAQPFAKKNTDNVLFRLKMDY
jgi:hypothetical protein